MPKDLKELAIASNISLYIFNLLTSRIAGGYDHLRCPEGRFFQRQHHGKDRKVSYLPTYLFVVLKLEFLACLNLNQYLRPSLVNFQSPHRKGESRRR